MSEGPPPQRDEPTPVLLVLLPRCPTCDCKKLPSYKRRYHDHYELRYCRCNQCGRNIVLRVEWPLTRNVP